MDTPSLRRKVIVRLLSGPSFVVPVVAGLTIAVGGWAFGADAVLTTFAASTAFAVGVGALATRAAYRLEEITRSAYRDAAADAARESEAELDALAARLAADGDPRTEELLGDLRATHVQLCDQVRMNSTLPRAQLVEVAEKANQLVRSCLESLGRTLTLGEVAESMTTPEARASTLTQRERLIAEIHASVTHLGAILDGLRSLGLRNKDAQTLATLRGELEESLAVARRVEERMQAIQVELEHAGIDGSGQASRTADGHGHSKGDRRARA